MKGQVHLSSFLLSCFFNWLFFTLFGSSQAAKHQLYQQFYLQVLMKNDIFGVKKLRPKKSYHRRNIRTETEDVNTSKQMSRMSQKAHQNCQSFLKAVNDLCIKNKSKPHILNISIPLSQNNSSRSKAESFEFRMNKFKEYFISKLRRKEQARSKILLQRMQNEGRSVSLVELSQKWIQSSKPPQNHRDRGQAIKQMKMKVRQRNQFSFSQSKLKSEDYQYLSRLCSRNLG